MSRLWYTAPASVWEEALPLGNGRLGGMVYGGILNEKIQLNEESVWYGWIHRAREVFDSEEGKALKAKWGIPESYAGIGNCILGYPVEEAPAKPRKDGYVIFG